GAVGSTAAVDEAGIPVVEGSQLSTTQHEETRASPNTYLDFIKRLSRSLLSIGLADTFPGGELRPVAGRLGGGRPALPFFRIRTWRAWHLNSALRGTREAPGG